MLLGGAQAATQPAAPAGLTGMALDARIELAWQPVSGADHYSVYRGSSPTTITTAVTPAGGITGTSFTDTSALNGTSYYYAVRAVNAGTESPNSVKLQATAADGRARPGMRLSWRTATREPSWKLTSTPTVSAGGIEGYATASSINHGESLDLKVNTAAGVSYSAYVYRSGYYGSSGARLYSVITGLVGTAQPACSSDATTGLIDCSNWSASATITTTANWPSGAYLVRLVRADNGAQNHVLFVVRDDSRSRHPLRPSVHDLSGVQPVRWEVAVPVQLDGREYRRRQSRGGQGVVRPAVRVRPDRRHARLVYAIRLPMVYWLEHYGYDVAYQSDTDMELNGARVKNHKAYVLGAHDEYYSAAMRTALEQARDAGTDLFDTGANALY